MTPWLDDGDVRLYHGDCLDVLRGLPDRSVHMCATSPPFYGLRDYGVDGQIGLEETPERWVERLVAVFREVRRVLRDDGTLWVEIGDSYNAYNSNRGRSDSISAVADDGRNEPPRGLTTADCKPKDLLGQPWLLAFALRADGWYLRSEIIWARPNPMPESVTDRPTKAHSTVFLLSKQSRYFYDADAIRTPYAYDGRAMTSIPDNGIGGSHENHAARKGRERWPRLNRQAAAEVMSGGNGGVAEGEIVHGGANARSVWTIPTEPTPFAHFATWPRKLVARMIQAGTSEHGCCPECGAPWERETVNTHDAEGRTTNGQKPRTDERRGFDVRMVRSTSTVGWVTSCAHGHEPVPSTVLDPFAGSGTTLKVARDHGRHAIGIELNEDYCRIAADRLAQQSLLTGDTA